MRRGRGSLGVAVLAWSCLPVQALLQGHLAALEASQRVSEARQLTAEREAAAAAKAAAEASAAAKAAAEAAAEERRQARAALSLSITPCTVSIAPEAAPGPQVPPPVPLVPPVLPSTAPAAPAVDAGEAPGPGTGTPSSVHAQSGAPSRHASGSPPGVRRTVADRRVSTVDGVVIGQEWAGVGDEPLETGAWRTQVRTVTARADAVSFPCFVGCRLACGCVKRLGIEQGMGPRCKEEKNMVTSVVCFMLCVVCFVFRVACCVLRVV
jgi:hypothetical protein